METNNFDPKRLYHINRNEIPAVGSKGLFFDVNSDGAKGVLTEIRIDSEYRFVSNDRCSSWRFFYLFEHPSRCTSSSEETELKETSEDELKGNMAFTGLFSEEELQKMLEILKQARKDLEIFGLGKHFDSITFRKSDIWELDHPNILVRACTLRTLLLDFVPELYQELK